MNASQCGNNYAVHHRRCFESLMISCNRLELDVCEHHTVRKRGLCRNVAPKVVNASKFAFPVLDDDDWSFSKSDASSLENSPKKNQNIERQEGPHTSSSLKRQQERSEEMAQTRDQSPQSAMRNLYEDNCSGCFRILSRCDDRWARRSQRKLQTSSHELYSTPPKRLASWVQFHSDDNHVVHPTKPARERRRSNFMMRMKSPHMRSTRNLLARSKLHVFDLST
jgi:hypothetical protein